MTPTEFLQKKNIVTEYVEAFTDRNGFIHIPLETILTEYAESLQLLQSCVVWQSEQLADFCKKVAKQQDCPEEFQEIINKEFWNLIS